MNLDGVRPPLGPAVTLVVPCFEEAAVLTQTLHRLACWFPDAAIVVVDDGSRDETASVARAFARQNGATTVIVLPQNAGKGRAVAAAADLVAGDRIVIVDADLAYRDEEIRRAAAALDDADMAVGNRRHADSTYTVPVRLFGFLYRRHGLGWLFNRLVRLTLGLTVQDTQCGLKAFRADAFRRLMPHVRTFRFAFDLEVWLLAGAFDLRVLEIPVAVRYESGRTSVRLLRDGSRMVADVLALVGRRLAGAYRRRV
ncbi:MAG: glycosyltransferase [Vicinamibacteraceae bacterium]